MATGPTTLTAKPRQHEPSWNIGAAIFAWLLPGLGHWLLGERQRAVILAVTIGSLWLAGLLIGGLGVIDRKAHPFWYMAQALTAPSLPLGQVADRLEAAQDRRTRLGESDFFIPSLGRVNEQGVLYTALAGLLNLLAVIDVLYRVPAPTIPAPAGKKEPSS